MAEKNINPSAPLKKEDLPKAGKKEILVMNPDGAIRSVSLPLFKELFQFRNRGFSIVDAGEYAKEVEEFMAKVRPSVRQVESQG